MYKCTISKCIYVQIDYVQMYDIKMYLRQHLLHPNVMPYCYLLLEQGQLNSPLSLNISEWPPKQIYNIMSKFSTNIHMTPLSERFDMYECHFDC